MKISIYRSIIEIDEKRTLIYSALQDKFLVCNKMEWERVGDGIWSNTDLVEKLKDIGVLIEDDVDEISIAKQSMDDIDNDMSFLHIHVNPTLQCNLRCWYCYENHVPSKMTSETVDAVIKLIHQKLQEKVTRHFQLSFFGGEPLLYFTDVVEPLVSAAKKLTEAYGTSFSVQFTSNGTLVNDRIIEFLKPLNVTFQITLDGGEAFHDKVRHMKGIGTYKLILCNIRRLAAEGKNIVLRINFTADNVDSIPEIFEAVMMWPAEIRAHIHIDLQQVWQDIDRTNEQVISTRIHQYMEDASSNGLTVSAPWKATNIRRSCYGDKANHVLINYNGDLYFCTARDFTRENRKGYLSPEGELVWENDALEKHMSIKFSNPVCRSCRIGPLCGGGCRQKAFESIGRSGCPLGFTEMDKDDIILKRFERFVIVPQYNK